MLGTRPTSDDDTLATKDFVKGQIGELRAEMGAMESRIGDRFTATNRLILIAVGILLTAMVLGFALFAALD